METNENDVYLSQYKLEQFVEIGVFLFSFGDYRKVIGTHNNIMWYQLEGFLIRKAFFFGGGFASGNIQYK